MKRQLGLIILSIILCFGLLTPVSAIGDETHFVDVPTNHWAFSFVERAYEDGVISGVNGDPDTNTGIFRPNSELSAAQFCAILVSGFYADEVENQQSVGDEWYAPYMAVATDIVLRTGCNINWSAVNSPISRYDASVLVAAILNDKGLCLLSDKQYKAIMQKIPDANSDEDGCEQYVATAIFYEIISGIDSDGCFGGDKPLTRAQAAVIYAKLSNILDCVQLTNFKYEPEFDYAVSDFLYRVMLCPEEVLNALHGQGWSIVFGDDRINEYDKQHGTSTAGLIYHNEKTIYVNSKYAVLHEIGHFLYRNLDSDYVEKCYVQEKDTAKTIFLEYALQNDSEFFAEYFEYYLINQDNASIMNNLKNKTPLMFAYMQQLESSGWL